MKALIPAAVLCGLIWMPAAGQRGGFGRGSLGRSSGPASTVGIPPLATPSPMMAPRNGVRPSGRGFGGTWFPGFYDGSQRDDYAYQAAPSIVVVPEAVQSPAPRRVAQGEVHDYTKTSAPTPVEGPPAEFTIVGRDHLAHSAVAVWAQDGALHYVDADGVAGNLPLGSVDREATRRANAANGLRLQVPAE